VTFLDTGLAMALGAVAVGVVLLVTLLWAVQRALIYFPLPDELAPVATALPGAEEVTFKTEDGLHLGGWFLPAAGPKAARPCCRAEDEATVVDMLASLGYRVVLDYRPDAWYWRMTISAKWIFTRSDSTQMDVESRLDCTARCSITRPRFTRGSIAGRPVPCLSARQQLRFHTGYELQDYEQQDLAKLRAAFRII
jgi:hypothetical protein